MQKRLPVRPNLDHLKSQAKDLLEGFRNKEPAALERFRAALPAASGADDARLATMKLALHDAQSVIAREYGFESWAALRAKVGSSSPTPEMLRALMQRHMSAPPPDEVQKALLAATAEERREVAPLGSPLPVLPLRNAVLAVGAVAPLNIGRPSSIAAVLAARDRGGFIAVFAQKEDANEAPGDADLHPVGCAAHLRSVISAPAGGTWVVVRATEWIRLETIVQASPYLLARVSRFDVLEGDSSEVAPLEQALRERVRAFASKMPDPEFLLRRTERMSARELADAAIANLWCSVEDKARYASEPNLVARLQYVIALIDRAA